MVPVAVKVDVSVGEYIETVFDGVTVPVVVFVGVKVNETCTVEVAVAVPVKVEVGVGVMVAVELLVHVGVKVAVSVFVDVRVAVGVGMPVNFISSIYMVRFPGLSHWKVTLCIILRSSTLSPSPVGEYASTVNEDNGIVTSCQPETVSVIGVFLSDHCCPFVSTIFTKNFVPAGASIQKSSAVAPVKSL
jgi:hypothetical protein